MNHVEQIAVKTISAFSEARMYSICRKITIIHDVATVTLLHEHNEESLLQILELVVETRLSVIPSCKSRVLKLILRKTTPDSHPKHLFLTPRLTD